MNKDDVEEFFKWIDEQLIFIVKQYINLMEKYSIVKYLDTEGVAYLLEIKNRYFKTETEMEL